MVASNREAFSESMIEADGLSKFYGEFAAAQDITFSVPRGVEVNDATFNIIPIVADFISNSMVCTSIELITTRSTYEPLIIRDVTTYPTA